MEVLEFITLGIIPGIVGQGARAVVGMKKQYDKNSGNWFDGRLLITTLVFRLCIYCKIKIPKGGRIFFGVT